jgi:predicted amidohydrolase
MRVLACQITVPPVTEVVERDRNVDRVAATISAALVETSCDLVLLPELFTIDYSIKAFDSLDSLAEPLAGRTVQVFSALAQQHDCHIAISFPRRQNQHKFISIIVLAPDGSIVGSYDKLHIANFGASFEKDYFQPGGNFLTFDCAGIRCATIICYDFRFPELIHHLAIEQGADLILHPVAFKRDSTFNSWSSFVICRALENQLYFLSLNRAGAEYGSSIFCPPWIDEKTQPAVFSSEETLNVFEVDKDVINNVRATYPFRADRISDYKALSLGGSKLPASRISFVNEK